MASDAADNLFDKMKAEITKLSSFPKKHALIDEEPWRTEGVRKIVVKNFLIYYFGLCAFFYVINCGIFY